MMVREEELCIKYEYNIVHDAARRRPPFHG